MRKWQVALPMARRWRLEDAAARWVRSTTGREPLLDHEPRWAGGLPIHVSGHPYAVLRPEPRVVGWAALTGMVVLTAGRTEHALTLRHASEGTTVVDLTAEAAPGAAPGSRPWGL